MFHKKLSLGLTTNLGKLCHLFEPQFHKKKMEIKLFIYLSGLVLNKK